VSPVKYELGFYIPEDGILHSHCREQLKSYYKVVHKSQKNGVFWAITPCGSCKNGRFGGTWCLHHQGDKNLVCSVRRLVVTGDVSSSSIVVRVNTKALSSSETSVLTTATWRNTS
jgi:hypothetical protein